MSRNTFRSVLVASAAVGLAAGVATVPAGAAPPPTRQAAFAAAAAEFGVPESVLLGVSYLESRWNTNGGTPSTSAGYGPMHLTDVVAANAGAGTHHDDGLEDARGDSARPALLPHQAQPDDVSSPSLRTVDVAARLTGVDTATLRSDPVQNIRGGAALLADYQRALGVPGSAPADWYGAVARYSGAQDTGSASAFANEVFATINEGVDRVTDDGQRVRLAPTAVSPNTGQVNRLGLRTTRAGEAECPASLGCEWLPAPYEQYGPGSTDYGNHDLGNRPGAQKIDYIVIHDTEGSYATTLNQIQDPTYVSWNYTLRSSDGHIAQHVKAKDVAWHAGNWYINAKAIGLEHEGFAAQGTWFTEALYRTSAKLVGYLAAKYGVPLDRQHILGHDNVPGTLPSTVRGMHWDPGPYWDWAHYFDLLHAPFRSTGTPLTGLVTVRPNYEKNTLPFIGCDAAGQPCPARGSTSVVLRTEPRDDAPQLVDLGLHPDGTPGTMVVSDHSSRAETGQTFAIAERRAGWVAVWYLGQKGWFHSADAIWSLGFVATPKKGRDSIPVYGRAYPEAAAYPAGIPVQAVTPLQYSLLAGQEYAVGAITSSEYYWAVTYDASNHTVVRGQMKYLEVQFGHRVAFVNLDDVDVRLSFL
ncbi:N-acetylmuramoyl-L-alanine amidase [Actinophytocola oryzae]|uniref:N-acetylmuramoyl-L-alanine amidase n=1 Tax=Actinophytocola oryzae TaxID=502181 RepID=A0A4R7VDS5_9PSEU|nr:N-acetylmuramoyl-L-alanine amidase [Actinophytocola oryzae]TDV47197.1 N-acetylmuramoyl-L-alanine amidase [Actinophytocola oryzae]